MKIGVCAGAQDAARVKASGCDYIEMNFTGLARASEAEFAQTRQALAQAGLRCEALNCFIPGEFKLCSPELDREALAEFLSLGFERAKALGAEVVVFGSGAARKLPEGVAKPEGWQTLAPLCRLAGDFAAQTGIAIAIEPLCYAEDNAVNTVREGLSLMRLANHPNVRLLADMYHMGVNGEDYQDILQAGADLRHCHIARPAGRVYPLPGDGYDYAPFFAALRGVGYAGRISIEAKAPNGPEDLAASVGYLRALQP